MMEEFEVRRATSADRAVAAQRLVERNTTTERDRKGARAGRRFLDSAETHGIDLTELWFSVAGSDRESAEGAGARQGRSEAVREACLVVPGSGGCAMVFTSTPGAWRPGIAGNNGARGSGEGSMDARGRELGTVIGMACESAGARGAVTLAQALLDPSSESDRLAMGAFERAGFRSVGTLAYMSRAMPGRGWLGGESVGGKGSAEEGWPEGFRPRRYLSADEPALIEALDRTYLDTLDCPELYGLRATRDIFESHKLTGAFDPGLWWMLDYRGRIEGACLLNPCPEQSTVELVYLGLSPVARGRGLGRRLLALGLEKLAGRRERVVNLAVDERNTPARRVYESLGFRAVTRRAALVKPLTPRADCAPPR